MTNKEFSKKFKQRIYHYILGLVGFVKKLDWKDPVCKVARDQLTRSGTSMGANYIEAIAGSSNKDFANYLNHSLKSANETQFWLALLRDADSADKSELNDLLRETSEISRILAASVKTLRAGTKNKDK